MTMWHEYPGDVMPATVDLWDKLKDTPEERELAPGLPVVMRWTATPSRRRYALSLELAGMPIDHGWELVALDAVEAENAREMEVADLVTGPGWYLFALGDELRPDVAAPAHLPPSPLLSVLLEKYAAQMERLTAEPLPEHPGRLPRRKRTIPSDDEALGWFVAADCVDGVLIDPELPENFSSTPNDARDPDDLDRWEGRPYITTTTLEDLLEPFESYRRAAGRVAAPEELEKMRQAWEVRQATLKESWPKESPGGVVYCVECLDGGAWDRPTDWGQFDTLAEALECAKLGPVWRRS